MADIQYSVKDREDLPDGSVTLSLQSPGRKVLDHVVTCRIEKSGRFLQLIVEESTLPSAKGDKLFFNPQNLRAAYGSPKDIR